MGGKKKLSLKQMERKQRTSRGKKGKKEKTAGFQDKERSGIVPPDPKDEKVIGELENMRVLTPYNVASRFNIRISVAKHFLKQLEEQGLVQMVNGNHNLKIYKAAD